MLDRQFIITCREVQEIFLEHLRQDDRGKLYFDRDPAEGNETKVNPGKEHSYKI